MITNARGILDHFGLKDLNPMEVVSELPPETRQIIEILKSINRKSKVLCLDEPTASLTESGAEEFFKLLEALKEKGITIQNFKAPSMDQPLKQLAKLFTECNMVLEPFTVIVRQSKRNESSKLLM